MRYFIIAALLAVSAPLFSALHDHLQTIPEKPKGHSMRNIDFIYMINLDERPEKYAQSLAQLSPYGIIPYRFSAVNGWKLPLEIINDVGVKYQSWMKQGLMGTSYPLSLRGQPKHEVMGEIGKTYFCHCMSRGAIGIALSHLSILKDAYRSGYETIWVMEDDIQVIRDPRLLSDLINRLDQLVGTDKWDFLFTDLDTKNKKGEYVPCTAYAHRPDFTPSNANRFWARSNISPEFRQVGARYGAYSMIVRRSGMEKMLEFSKSGIFLPYDMEYPLPNNIRMYTVRSDIVSTLPNALSDNGGPNYQSSPTP